MSEAKLVKVLTDSYYGKFGNAGFRGGYVFRGGFRGAGRLFAALQHVGYEELLGKLIRIRLHYPLWYGGDDLIRELNLRCHIFQARGGGKTIFVDSSDPD